MAAPFRWILFAPRDEALRMSVCGCGDSSRGNQTRTGRDFVFDRGL